MELELNIKFKNYSSLGSISGPMIVKNKVQLPFSSEFVGSTSASLNFEVTGLNLTNNIVITAPAGFIINTNNTNANQSPINLAPSSGNVPTTIIYVKFKPVAGIVYNANISLTSIGATSRSINVIGLGLVDTAPVYNPATIDINQTAQEIGEIGEYYNNIITADYTQNDAGALGLIRIEKDGSDILPNGSGSPHVVSDTGYFDVVPIVYQAFADYAAGAIKNYTPSGNVDARAALVRNANAPQAAENNFASATKILTGELYIFFGAFNLAPSNSSEVRKLPLKISTTEALSGVFVLFTGNIFQDFSICIPSGLNLVEVRDLDSGNVDITSSYVLNSFNVVDLAGNSNAYKNYIFPKGSPYSSNHHHQIKLA